MTAPRKQPSLYDELNAAGGCVDREHAQVRMANCRRDEERDTTDNRHAVGEQQRPLIAELRAAAENDDELRRTAHGCPDAEDRKDGRNASGRGHPEGDGRDGAGPRVESARRSTLPA